MKLSPKGVKKAGAAAHRFVDIDIHTYKEMEFALTKVGGNQKVYPRLGQTTSKREEDILRDQLLEVRVRQGDVQVRRKLGVNTLSTKSAGKLAPKLGKYKSEVRLALEEARAAQPKAEARKNTVDKRDYVQPDQLKAQARVEVERMRHKAFWVHNSEAYQDAAITKSKDDRNHSHSGAVKPDRSQPLLNNKKSNMQLVQQYVMVRGRLQPALKYKVAQPMYNRYKFEQAGGEDF